MAAFDFDEADLDADQSSLTKSEERVAHRDIS